MAAPLLDEAPAPELEHEVFEVVERFSYKSKIFNGGLAGIVGVSCVFPLDLIKTRWQNQKVDNPKYKQVAFISFTSMFTRIAGFYQGASINVLLITPEKAIKLVANDYFRHQLASPGEKNLGALRGMLAGGLAGMFQVIVTTPMELLKIRMQQSERPVSLRDVFRHLFADKGLLGLYRGIGPTLARDVSFSVIYFPLFAQLDSLGPRKNDGSGDAVFYASFISGLIAAGLAAFSVTPIDVVKTRIQTGGSGYTGVSDALIKIGRQEGVKALFKGAICRMMVMAPLFGIAQMVYFIGVAEKLGIGQKIKD
ncbi:unnamed protein product, partial [Mesorhabditis belari]|uniref:Mitochondrial carrier protein n=1 Tax=Mesorhabditis belari TaxID=2138241 RepID=A0AAF3FLY2_9BILA